MHHDECWCCEFPLLLSTMLRGYNWFLYLKWMSKWASHLVSPSKHCWVQPSSTHWIVMSFAKLAYQRTQITTLDCAFFLIVRKTIIRTFNALAHPSSQQVSRHQISPWLSTDSSQSAFAQLITRWSSQCVCEKEQRETTHPSSWHLWFCLSHLV